jgi:hypothetical protein
VLVLPDNDGVVIQIRDVGSSDTLGVLLHHHPADVGVEETLADTVWILLGTLAHQISPCRSVVRDRVMLDTYSVYLW